MPVLPPRLSLEQVRRLAKDLLRDLKDGDRAAIRRLAVVSPPSTLAGAQLAIAREYGFPSWARPKRDVAIYDRITVAGPEIVGVPADPGGLRARFGAGAARKGCTGAPDRIRTCDLRLRRPTLYPLSYRRADRDDTGSSRRQIRTGRELPSARLRTPRPPDPGRSRASAGRA